MKIYVVTEPESARGIYTTWAECEARVLGVQGAKFQAVDSRENAELMLGDGIILKTGVYAFTDGNAMGGVGVVVVQQRTRTASASSARSLPPLAGSSPKEASPGSRVTSESVPLSAGFTTSSRSSPVCTTRSA